MSRLSPIARPAFDAWRRHHPDGTLDDFFRRPEAERRGPARTQHKIATALRRLADPTLPARKRTLIQDDLRRWRETLAG